MGVLPVITRELIVQARRRGLYVARVSIALMAVGVVIWILGTQSVLAASTSHGRDIFTALSRIALVCCVIMGALQTASCLSTEKREGTLGLLFLTDLKSRDIVLGKLFSAGVAMLYGLLGIVPVLAMTLLLGGITTLEVVEMTLLLLNTLFLSMTAGLLASALIESDRRAVLLALLFALGISTGPLLLGFWASANLPPISAWQLEFPLLLPTPFQALHLLENPTVRSRAIGGFYASLLQDHLIAWMWVFLASGLVARLSVERGIPQREMAVRSGRWQRAVGWVRQWGQPTAKFRKDLLDRNPVMWLCLRTPGKQATVWLLILSLSCITAVAYWKYRLAFLETVLFLHLILCILVKVWFASEVCQRWSPDLQSGAMELLLCTPLRTGTIMGGQNRALLHQFGLPIAAIALLSCVAWKLIASAPIDADSKAYGQVWILIACPVLVADLLAIRWMAAWFSLLGKGLNRSVLRSLVQVLGVRSFVFLGFLVFTHSWPWGRMLRDEAWLNLRPWLMIGLILNAWLIWVTRRKVLRFLRAIVANPGNADELLNNQASEEAQPRRQFLTWIPELNQQQVRSLVWRAILVVVVGIATVRSWMGWQVERRLDALRAASQPVAFRDLGALRKPNFSTGVDVARELEKLSRARISSNPLADAKPLHQLPSLAVGAYEQDFSSPVAQSQLDGFIRASRALIHEVNAACVEGPCERAAKSLGMLLELCQSIAIQPSPWWHGASVQTLGIAGRATELVLNHCRLEPNQIRALAATVTLLDSTNRMPTVIAGWRCAVLEGLGSGTYGYRLNAGAPPSQMEVCVQMALGLHHYRTLQTLDTFQRFAEIAMKRPVEAMEAGRTLALTHPVRPSAQGMNPMLIGLEGNFHSMLVQEAIGNARVRLALTALAVERYRTEKGGRLPGVLVDLVPDYLAEAPQDPFTHQPIRYELRQDGFRIFCLPNREARAMLQFPSRALEPSSLSMEVQHKR